MEEFKTYDLKLKDGRYFSSVVISDEFGACDSIGVILDNYYYKDNGEKSILPMSAWDKEDEDYINELVIFKSDNIEYIAVSYKNKN